MRKDSTKRERWVAVVKDSHWGFITIQERARGLGKKKKKKDGEELQIVVKKILANSCLSLDRMFQPWEDLKVKKYMNRYKYFFEFSKNTVSWYKTWNREKSDLINYLCI